MSLSNKAAFSVSTLFALVALVFSSGCGLETDFTQPGDAELGTSEMAISASFATGAGTDPDSCPAGKERFYNLCYDKCPANYPIGHITMCFQRCRGYDTMVSPGNCETSRYNTNTFGRYEEKYNYPVPSVDRGAGTELVCGAGKITKKGRCYDNGGARPTNPTASPTPAPATVNTGTRYVNAQDECNHKQGYQWLDATQKCVTAAEFSAYLAAHPNAPTPGTEPIDLPCEVGQLCPQDPTKLNPSTGNSTDHVPTPGCMDSDDAFCFVRPKR